MAGLLIYESAGQVSSFTIFDNEEYNFVAPLIQKGHTVYFNKGDLSLEQLNNAREKVAEIVKNLNNKQKVDVKKELSSYFE